MASFRFTKLKITIGYILLLAILLFSLVFVHQEMETLSAADDQQNLRTDSLLTLLHEKDQNTLQMLRVLRMTACFPLQKLKKSSPNSRIR